MVDREKICAKIRGSFLGLAVGDALGVPTEGLSREEIKQNFGLVTGYIKSLKGHSASFLQPGQYSDDTQMARALAEALLEGRGFKPDLVAARFLTWGSGEDVRLAGKATLEAIGNLAKGRNWVEAGVYSAGCGGAMRVAPLGLVNTFKQKAQIKKESALSCRITHTDPRAIAGTQAVALALSLLIKQVEKDIDRDSFLNSLAAEIEDASPEMAEKILSISNTWGMKVEDALDFLGTNGFVLETVSSALYCFLKTPEDFKNTLLIAINAGGDTDSIAAIAGAFSGAYNGISRIPEEWLSGLEAREELDTIASKLCVLTLGGI